MKKLFIYFILLSVALSSCFKDYNDRALLKDNWVEFDLATSISKATGKNYSIVPGIDKITAVGRYRVNMTGYQSPQDIRLKFKVVDEESTAIEGYHYTFPNGNDIIIPANSSFGYLEVNVLPDPSGSAVLVVELLGDENIKPMDNYKSIAIPLDYLSINPLPEHFHDKGTYIQVDSVTVGSYNNNLLGCFVNMQTGAVHSRTQSKQDSHILDLNYQWSSSNNANFMSIQGQEIIDFGNPVRGIVTEWTVRNESNFIRYTNITSADNDIFDNISSGTDIENAYQDAVANVASRAGYSLTTYGPGRRIRDCKVGDIIFFRSIDRGYYAIMRITGLVTGANGSITFEYKTQKL